MHFQVILGDLNSQLKNKTIIIIKIFSFIDISIASVKSFLTPTWQNVTLSFTSRVPSPSLEILLFQQSLFFYMCYINNCAILQLHRATGVWLRLWLQGAHYLWSTVEVVISILCNLILRCFRFFKQLHFHNINKNNDCL